MWASARALPVVNRLLTSMSVLDLSSNVDVPFTARFKGKPKMRKEKGKFSRIEQLYVWNAVSYEQLQYSIPETVGTTILPSRNMEEREKSISFSPASFKL